MPGLNEGQAAFRVAVHDGTTELEVAITIVCGDLVCRVMAERNMVRLDGETVSQPWTLRVTMLFRRDAGTLTMLHRHADPLIMRRDLAATLELVPHAAERH